MHYHESEPSRSTVRYVETTRWAPRPEKREVVEEALTVRRRRGSTYDGERVKEKFSVRDVGGDGRVVLNLQTRRSAGS